MGGATVAGMPLTLRSREQRLRPPLIAGRAQNGVRDTPAPDATLTT